MHAGRAPLTTTGVLVAAVVLGSYPYLAPRFLNAADLPDFGGHHPICGVWIVDHEPAGLGLREDTRRITGNLSRFVPHYFTD